MAEGSDRGQALGGPREPEVVGGHEEEEELGEESGVGIGQGT